jgi:hypothetical protein
VQKAACRSGGGPWPSSPTTTTSAHSYPLLLPSPLTLPPPLPVSGCVDLGATEEWQKWLAGLNRLAWEVCIFAFFLSIFSSRHMRWWMAKFISPYAPIPCLVGDLTGSCGQEPACLHYGCRDCGYIFTPVTSGVFNLISAAMNLYAFYGFTAGTGARAIYRTEGPWLCITACGMSLAAAFFAFWSQYTVCPVKHVWVCDLHCNVADAWRDLDKDDAEDTNLPPPEPHQGIPHAVAAVSRRVVVAADFTTRQAIRARDFVAKTVRNYVLPPEFHDDYVPPEVVEEREAEKEQAEHHAFLRGGQGAKVSAKKSLAAAMRPGISRRTIDSAASPRGMSSQTVEQQDDGDAEQGGRGGSREQGGDDGYRSAMPASPGHAQRMSMKHVQAEVDVDGGNAEEEQRGGGEGAQQRAWGRGADEADEVSLSIPPPVRAAPAPPPAPAVRRRVVDEDSMFT